MDSQIFLALKNNKLLKNIDLTKINLGQIKGNLLTVQEGEIIYREGHPSDAIFLVVGGEINLLKKKLLGKTKSLIFNDNDFFGDEEYLEGTKRTSTTVALKDSYIIKLSKTEIDNLCEQDNTILDNLKNPSITEDTNIEHAEETPETQIEAEPDEIKEDITPDEFNISEEDFKIPEEVQSTIDSASEEIGDEFVYNIEDEHDSKPDNAVVENSEPKEEFSLDEQAFAESLKEKEDDVFFNIEDIDSIGEDEQTNINEEFLGEVNEEQTKDQPRESADQFESPEEIECRSAAGSARRRLVQPQAGLPRRHWRGVLGLSAARPGNCAGRASFGLPHLCAAGLPVCSVASP